MAQFCTECGKPLEDGVSFCTECGAKVAVPEPMPEPVQEVAEQVQISESIQQPVMQMEEVAPPPIVPVPQQQVQPVAPKAEDVPPRGVYAVAGTGSYFGLMFLFGIPVIGWLACFICAFTMKNKNLKNYIKSRVIWFFIKAVFWVGIFFLLRWVGNMITDAVGGIIESEFGGLSELFEQLKGLTDGLDELGNLSDSLGELGNVSDSLGNMEGLTEGLEGLENIPLQ